MISPALEKLRHQLYAQSVEAMTGRLRAINEPAAMFAALRWGMQELDRTFAATPARVKATVACRAGCGYCCSVPVDVQAHEVFFSAEHMRNNFTPGELARVIERTAAHRAQVSGIGRDARTRLRRPCVLLRENRCSIYEGRPAACRAHHTSNATLCAADSRGAPVDLEPVYIPPLRARLFAVMLGIDAALEAAGFDDRAYDFGSALHEALTNSLCQTLWLRRKPAFPDSCLADSPNEESAAHPR